MSTKSALNRIMNNTFSLSKLSKRIFPQSVSVGGVEYAIDPSVRTILRILRLKKDPDVLATHKIVKMCSLFFIGEKPQNPYAHLIAFLNAASVGAPSSEPREKQFCYEFDAREIYASFVQPHGNMALEEIQALHWYDFLIRLSNLPESSPFCQKIAVRFRDLNGLKGEAYARAANAKAQAQLPEDYTPEELEAEAEFEKEWGGVGGG